MQSRNVRSSKIGGLSSDYLSPLKVLFIPLLMIVLPSSLEVSFSIPLGDGYHLPVYDVIAIFVILTSDSKLLVNDIRFFFFYGLILFMSTLLLRDQIIVRFFSSIQFFIGYFLAYCFPLTPKGKKVLLYSSVVIFSFILVQQVIFSLGLGGVDVAEDSSASLGEGVFRAGTTVGTSNDTSHLMIILSCIILFFLKKEYLKIIMVLMMIISSLISGCRGSLIMCAFPVLYFIFELKEKKGFIVLIIVAFGFYYLATKYNVFELLQAREEAVMAYGDITSGRTERWEQAFSIIYSNIYTTLFGNGGGTIPHSMNYFLKTLASPHNCYIGILVETGFVGGLIFLIFLLKKMIKLRRLSFCVAGLAAVYLVSFNTEVYGLTLLASFYFWIIYFIEIRTNNLDVLRK